MRECVHIIWVGDNNSKGEGEREKGKEPSSSTKKFWIRGYG
jgi:hypothetical protein